MTDRSGRRKDSDSQELEMISRKKKGETTFNTVTPEKMVVIKEEDAQPVKRRGVGDGPTTLVEKFDL